MSSRSSSITSIFKGISFLSGEQIARIGLGLIANIVIARLLGPEDLGRLSLVLSFGVILSHFSVMGAHEPTIKYLIQKPDDHNMIMGTSIVLRLLGSIFGMVLTAVLLFFIANYTIEIKIFIFLLAFFQSFKALDCIYDFLLSKVKVQAIATHRTLITTFLTISKIILIYFFKDWRLLVAITFLELVLSSIIYFIHYRSEKLKIWDWEFNKKLFSTLTKESLPIFLLTFSVFAVIRVDQIMISQMLTFQDNGQYAISSRIIESFLFLPITITCIFYPSILKKEPVDFEKNIQRMYGILFSLALLQSIFFSIFSPYIIPLVFGEKYLPAVEPFIINCWSCVFIYWNLGRLKSGPIMGSVVHHMNYMVLLLILNIGLNYYFIPQMGIRGAAIASILGPVLLLTLCSIFSSRIRRDTYLFLTSPYNTVIYLYNYISRK